MSQRNVTNLLINLLVKTHMWTENHQGTRESDERMSWVCQTVI